MNGSLFQLAFECIIVGAYYSSYDGMTWSESQVD